MSDLTATHCGCNNAVNNNSGCGSWIWILILLSCCGGCGNSGDGCGIGGLCGGGNGGGCDSIIWILVLLCCCGGNSFC